MLPFEEIGLDHSDGLKITEAVNEYLRLNPKKSISIQTLSQQSGFMPNEIKHVLYLLFFYKKLKATFYPVHRKCGNTLGPASKSRETIRAKFESREICSCASCGELIESFDDIKILMTFWGINDY